MGKFPSKFAEFLYQLTLDGTWCDDEVTDANGWYGLIGRRLLWEDTQGFVGYERYRTVAEAEAEFYKYPATTRGAA